MRRANARRKEKRSLKGRKKIKEEKKKPPELRNEPFFAWTREVHKQTTEGEFGKTVASPPPPLCTAPETVTKKPPESSCPRLPASHAAPTSWHPYLLRKAQRWGRPHPSQRNQKGRRGPPAAPSPALRQPPRGRPPQTRRIPGRKPRLLPHPRPALAPQPPGPGPRAAVGAPRSSPKVRGAGERRPRTETKEARSGAATHLGRREAGETPSASILLLLLPTPSPPTPGPVATGSCCWPGRGCAPGSAPPRSSPRRRTKARGSGPRTPLRPGV